MDNPYRLILNAYRSRSGGQALILILLVMSVSLLIGVGVSFRATSTLRQISFSEQSAQAYAFAEAGAEYALNCLKAGTCSPGDSGSLNVDGEGGDDVRYQIEEFGNEQTVTGFSPLEQGESVEINLDGFPGGSFIQLYWVKDGSVEESKPAALVVHFVYLEGGVYKLRSHAFDPDDGGRRLSNKFDWGSSIEPGTGWQYNCASLAPGYTVDEITYQHRCRIRIPAPAESNINVKALRLTPLYNDDVPNTFAIDAPGRTLPRQGAVIVSRGEAGQAIRAVEVVRTDPVLPNIFDYVYYSGSSL